MLCSKGDVGTISGGGVRSVDWAAVGHQGHCLDPGGWVVSVEENVLPRRKCTINVWG